MPTGGSAETREEPALVKTISLSISIDEFNQQREALRLELAARYNVDPSLVTLEAQAGSVQITLTIATTNGTSAPVSIDTLTQAVEQVDDATLAASITTVVGTTVSVTSQNATTSSVQVTVETSCPRGKWCTAGVVVGCPAGTYNNLVGQTDQRACRACPDGSQSKPNSTDISQCECEANYERIVDNATHMKCWCKAGFSLEKGSCKACPVGQWKGTVGDDSCNSCPLSDPLTDNTDAVTVKEGATSAANCTCPAQYFANVTSARLASGAPFTCVPCRSIWAISGLAMTECEHRGITLDSVPVVAGMWRESATSRHVRQCRILASGGEEDSHSSCLGGDMSVEDHSPCAEGYTGPLCELCEDTYYGGKGAPCTECSDAPLMAVLWPVFALFGALALVCAVLIRFRKSDRVVGVLKRLSTASMTVIDNASADSTLRSSLKASAKATLEDKVTDEVTRTDVAEEGKKEDPIARRVRKLGAFAQSFGVKLRILIALYQVLTQLGVTFSITQPTFYSQMIAQVRPPTEQGTLCQCARSDGPVFDARPPGVGDQPQHPDAAARVPRAVHRKVLLHTARQHHLPHRPRRHLCELLLRPQALQHALRAHRRRLPRRLLVLHPLFSLPLRLRHHLQILCRPLLRRAR
jgi:hypothetical protein